MDTPVAPGRGAVPAIYGEGDQSINRRALIVGAGLLAVSPAMARGRPNAVAALLAASGGLPVLQRVRAVLWTGTMHRGVGKSAEDLGIETRIEPFQTARWMSWSLEDGRASANRLVVDRDYGFEVLGGEQRALAPDRLIALRQQFAMYGYMLLAGASLSASGGRVTAERPGFPAMRFTLGRHGMASADYVAAFGDAPAAPVHLAFDGVVEDQGVRWPRHIVITDRKKTRTALTIEDFSVELAPA
jgi:hypothetical protein